MWKFSAATTRSIPARSARVTRRARWPVGSYPLWRSTAAARWSIGLPDSSDEIPTLSVSTSIPSSAAIVRATRSAIGERQMLPQHTNTTFAMGKP